jgi:hypothetical protein
MKFDLRSNRRLHLKKPVDGMLLGDRVDIVDMSLNSVGIEHEFEIRLGASVYLEFRWGQTSFRLPCTVARTRATSRTGRWSSGLTIRASSDSAVEYRKRVEAGLTRLREIEASTPSML